MKKGALFFNIHSRGCFVFSLQNSFCFFELEEDERVSFLLVSAQLFCILLKIKYGFRFQGQFNEVIQYFSELAALTTKYGMSLQRHIHYRPSE